MASGKFSTPRKDDRRLLACLERAGWKIKQGKTHIMVMHPETEFKYVLALTASDGRGSKNALQAIRKACGGQIPGFDRVA